MEVDTEQPDPTLETEGEAQHSEEEEFAFPLFGSSNKDNVMTVSMKEEDEEVIVNERPVDYYIATYSEEDRRRFQETAITAEAIFAELSLPAVDVWPWKVMDLKKHNEKVANEKLRSRRRRPGMKKRLNAISCRERRIQREKEAKKVEKEAFAKLKKNMYKKFKPSGRKVKPVKQASKPKYRTE